MYEASETCTVADHLNLLENIKYFALRQICIHV